MKEGTVKTGKGIKQKSDSEDTMWKQKKQEDVSDLSGGKDSVVCEWMQCGWPGKMFIRTWIVKREKSRQS